MFICLAIYSVCQYCTVLQFKRPTSQRYFEALMESSNVDWKDICYHARPLLTFGTVKSENLKSPLCFVSQQRKLLFIYLVNIYMYSIYLESNLGLHFRLYYYLWCHTAECHSWFYRHPNWTLFTNHLLPIYKWYLYKARDSKNFKFFNF